MRRHVALQDLSRDHFVALNVVLRVRRAVEGHALAEPLADVWQAFLDLTRHPLPAHFEQEERLLLPLLDGECRPLGRRMEQEHAALRIEFAKLAGMAPEAGVLWEVAQGLERHVRWEEESLFPSLQVWLGEGQMADLREASERFRVRRGLPVGPA